MSDASPSFVVMHVGNAANGGGGIATVIRHHLKRSVGVDMQAVASYDQDRPAGWRRSVPAIAAAWRILATRPRQGLLWHFHLSLRGSYLREGLLVWVAAARRHRGILVTLHGSDLTSMSSTHQRLVSWTVRPASLVHVLSSAHRDLIRHPRRVVIHNDVPIPVSVKAPGDRLRQVIFAGEICFRKGVDVLVEAWQQAELEDWRLILCGPEGDFDVACLASVARASWRGRVDHHDLMRMMEDSAVSVLPSREEAFPMSLCEAMAAGCGVVATDVGGTRDLLGAGNPFLIPAGDPGVLRDRLVRLASEPATLAQASAENRARARLLVATGIVNQTWLDVYSDMACRRTC